MIDRYPNKVAITSQDRLQPMDKWEDYPIKVPDMAPLIMVTLRTVSSFFSTCGCFFRVDSILLWRSPSSLSSLWMTSRCEWTGAYTNLGLKVLRVEEKGGPNRPPEWARPASLGRLAQARPGPVRSPLRSRGSSCIYALCPLHLHYFEDVILVSKMEVLLAWSSVF
jgi:hypothetical protein